MNAAVSRFKFTGCFFNVYSDTVMRSLLLRESQGLLWKHLSLILGGVEALMNAAPRILTNAAFHLALPLCFYKDVCCRISKYTHSSQNCPQSQHSLLTQHHITVWYGQLRQCRAGKYRASDPQSVCDGRMCVRFNHATSEPYNIRKVCDLSFHLSCWNSHQRGVWCCDYPGLYVGINLGYNPRWKLTLCAELWSNAISAKTQTQIVFWWHLHSFRFCDFVLSCNMPSLVSSCVIKQVFMLYCMFLASSSKCQNHFQSIAVDVVPYSASSLSCMEFYDDWFVDFVVGRRLCNTQQHDVSGWLPHHHF